VIQGSGEKSSKQITSWSQKSSSTVDGNYEDDDGARMSAGAMEKEATGIE
jgi:hypothetical protein